MNTPEQVPEINIQPFELEFGDFDINAASQEAIQGVATDTEIALEEKVRRMEAIVSEGTSEVYREFVDFRAMAAQMEMMCSHDHALNQAAQGNETLLGFMDSQKSENGHNHSDKSHDKHTHQDDDEEIDPKTGKKKKKKTHGWFLLAHK